MTKKPYLTAGRQKLLSFLESNPDRQFTTDELCAASGETARSSVYRRLSELCERGVIRKFHSEARNCSVYQYVGSHCDCSTHLHEKCVLCGKIEHLDCHDSESFIAHLLAEHGFAVDCGQTILYGVCAACRAGKGERA